MEEEERIRISCLPAVRPWKKAHTHDSSPSKGKKVKVGVGKGVVVNY